MFSHGMEERIKVAVQGTTAGVTEVKSKDEDVLFNILYGYHLTNMLQ